MRKYQNFISASLPNWDHALFLIVLAYFLIKLCFFATSIQPGISPDELYHTELSLIYQKHDIGPLQDSPATYHLEVVSHKPYLYALLMGKLLSLNFFQIPPILFLRFMNILISLLTVWICYRLFILLSPDKLVRILGIVVLTNIPMYSFLSAFVNYDNLANLWAVLSFYYFFSFIKKRSFNSLQLMVIFSLLGCLTKYSYIPLFVILLALLGMDRMIHGPKNTPFFADPTGEKNFRNILLKILIFALVTMNAFLYINNLYQFKRFYPECTQVLTLGQCLENTSTYTANFLLQQLAKTLNQSQFLKFPDYLFQWGFYMEKSIFGIFGHKLFFRNSLELLPYHIVFFFFGILCLWNFRLRKNIVIMYSVLCFSIYAAILLYHVNYRSYLQTGFLLANLQGRYLFPVIYPLIFVFCHYLLNYLKNTPKTILFIMVTLIFVYNDLPYFTKHVDKSWYINEKLNDPWALSRYLPQETSGKVQN